MTRWSRCPAGSSSRSPSPPRTSSIRTTLTPTRRRQSLATDLASSSSPVLLHIDCPAPATACGISASGHHSGIPSGVIYAARPVLPASRTDRHRLRAGSARQALHLGRHRAGRIRLLRPGNDGLPDSGHRPTPHHLPAGHRFYIPVDGLTQLQPGDLAVHTTAPDGTPSDPGHVGMFIGDGLVIQAPQTGQDIMLTPLAGYWQQNTTAIRRLV